MKLILKIGKLIDVKPENYKFKCTYAWAVIIESVVLLLGLILVGFIAWTLAPSIGAVIQKPQFIRSVTICGGLAAIVFSVWKGVEYPKLVKNASVILGASISLGLIVFNVLSDNTLLLWSFNLLATIIILGILNLHYRIWERVLSRFCEPL